ncbi:calcium-binding protein [Streptomyces sp. NPDC057010]
MSSAAAAAGAALLFTVPGAALAAPGDLDPTFGEGGVVITDLIYYEYTNDMVLQPDGKILTVGSQSPAEGGENGSDFSLVRYNPNGSPDPGFGDGGAVTTDFSPSDDAQGVALQSDGKIIVAGNTWVEENGVTRGQFTVLRYTANGTLDPTFGTDGRVFPDFGPGSGAGAVRVLSDDRILAAGGAQGDFALVRLTPGGSLDTTFGDGDGRVTTQLAGGNASVEDLALQPSDGKIVAVGRAGAYTNNSTVALARYGADGSPDPTFDNDGNTTVDWGTADDVASGVVLQPDDKPVVAGYGSEGFTTARFNTNGSPDTSFGGDGRVGTTFETGLGAAHDVALQPDGKIVTVGVGGGPDGGHDFAVARLTSAGVLDGTFSGDGKVTTDVGYDFFDDFEEAHAVSIQPDGKLVVAGVTNDSTARAVVRYEVTGTTPPPPPPTADVSVTKDGATSLSLGDPVTYTVRVTNNSTTTAATGVQLTDALSGTAAGTILGTTTSQGSCTTSPTQATCALGTLPVGTTATVTITAEPSRSGTLTDTATAGAQNDTTPGNNSASRTTTVTNTRGCTIVGTSGNDTLNGGYGNDVICALSGNDTVNASFGNDTVHAGPGNDRVDGGYGNDTLIGGPGSDTLTGNFGSDTLNTVDGVSGNDTANGGYNTDTCTTDPGDTRISCP